jgi:hypothetical protein
LRASLPPPPDKEVVFLMGYEKRFMEGASMFSSGACFEMLGLARMKDDEKGERKEGTRWRRVGLGSFDGWDTTEIDYQVMVPKEIFPSSA